MSRLSHGGGRTAIGLVVEPPAGRRPVIDRGADRKRDGMRRRELLAGGLMAVAGIGITMKGSTYRLGSLSHMGPGFFPTVLGAILIVLGLAIAAAPYAPGAVAAEDGHDAAPDLSLRRAWLCILLSPVLFIVFGRSFGMIPGAFACVLIAALGDRDATLRGCLILAAVVTIFGAALFSWILQVPMPLLTWGIGA